MRDLCVAYEGGLGLPPISHAIAHQTRWMTLIEALTHVQMVESCDRVVAQVHLKCAIGQGVIPAKWADSSGPKDKPDVTKLRRSQLVLSEPGLAPSGSSLRPLLVLREAVHAIWPLTTGKGPAPPEVDSSVKSYLAPSEAEEERGQWMSLVEAIEHIQIARHCDSIEALCQFKQELRDGMVRVEWEDSEGAKDCPDPKFLQASQLLLIGTGLALDNVQEIYRPLSVERSAVRKLWPLPSYRHEGSRQAVSQAAGQQRQNKRPASEAQIREGLRKIYADPSNDSPNVNVAYDLLKLELPNARKNSVMQILKEPEFKDQRRDPGNQPKR
jgi:hypothetical protein